ncbi:MAG: hypothetical protein EOP84_26140, partial [Verrucomicrobiaceae bacterium]
MNASIEHLINRVAADSHCEIQWRDAATPLAPPGHHVPHIPSGPLPPKLDVILPDDMLYFRARIAKVNLFAKTLPEGMFSEPNGWNLWNVDYWG